MSCYVLDTDVLSEVLAGNQRMAARVLKIVPGERATSVVTVEELLRGRLAMVRRAESRGQPSLVLAYARLASTVADLSQLRLCHYTEDAEVRFEALRKVGRRERLGTLDLRIAAIALAHDAVLVTRNRRHFEAIPGLAVEIWD